MVKRSAPASRRTTQLRTMLEERRRLLMGDVNGRIRDVRRGSDREVVDEHESADADSQEDLDLALIQMKADTLRRIDAALRRLEKGAYGNCAECGDPIAPERLTALPFAVRCKDCEELRENSSGPAHRVRSRTAATSPRLDLVD